MSTIRERAATMSYGMLPMQYSELTQSQMPKRKSAYDYKEHIDEMKVVIRRPSNNCPFFLCFLPSLITRV